MPHRALPLSFSHTRLLRGSSFVFSVVNQRSKRFFLAIVEGRLLSSKVRSGVFFALDSN